MAEEKKFTFCSNCGAKMPKNTKFCPECGKAVPDAIRNAMTIAERPVPAPVQKAVPPAPPKVQTVPAPVQPLTAERPQQEPSKPQKPVSEPSPKLSRAAALALPGGVFCGIAAVLLLARFAGGLRPVLDTLGVGTGSFTEYLENNIVLIGAIALAVIMIGLIVLANRKRLIGSLTPIGVTFLIAGIIVCALILTPLPAKRTLITAAALLFAGAAILIAASFLDRKRLHESSENSD